MAFIDHFISVNIFNLLELDAAKAIFISYGYGVDAYTPIILRELQKTAFDTASIDGKVSSEWSTLWAHNIDENGCLQILNINQVTYVVDCLRGVERLVQNNCDTPRDPLKEASHNNPDREFSGEDSSDGSPTYALSKKLYPDTAQKVPLVNNNNNNNSSSSSSSKSSSNMHGTFIDINGPTDRSTSKNTKRKVPGRAAPIADAGSGGANAGNGDCDGAANASDTKRQRVSFALDTSDGGGGADANCGNGDSDGDSDGAANVSAKKRRIVSFALDTFDDGGGDDANCGGGGGAVPDASANANPYSCVDRLVTNHGYSPRYSTDGGSGGNAGNGDSDGENHGCSPPYPPNDDDGNQESGNGKDSHEKNQVDAIATELFPLAMPQKNDPVLQKAQKDNQWRVASVYPLSGYKKQSQSRPPLMQVGGGNYFYIDNSYSLLRTISPSDPASSEPELLVQTIEDLKRLNFKDRLDLFILSPIYCIVGWVYVSDKLCGSLLLRAAVREEKEVSLRRLFYFNVQNTKLFTRVASALPQKVRNEVKCGPLSIKYAVDMRCIGNPFYGQIGNGQFEFLKEVFKKVGRPYIIPIDRVPKRRNLPVFVVDQDAPNRWNETTAFSSATSSCNKNSATGGANRSRVVGVKLEHEKRLRNIKPSPPWFTSNIENVRPFINILMTVLSVLL